MEPTMWQGAASKSLELPQDDLHRMERQLLGLCPECGRNVVGQSDGEWIFYDVHHSECPMRPIEWAFPEIDNIGDNNVSQA